MARIAIGGFQHETNTFSLTPASLADFEAQRARHQRHRAVDHQVIMVEALLVALLDDVAEALGGDHPHLGPVAFDHDVGRHRGAMEQRVDLAGLNPRDGAKFDHALHHGDRLVRDGG